MYLNCPLLNTLCSSAVIKCSLPGECHCSTSGDLHKFSKHLSYNTRFICCNQGKMAPAKALLAVQAASCQVISVTAPACCWQSVPNNCVYTLILIMNLQYYISSGIQHKKLNGLSFVSNTVSSVGPLTHRVTTNKYRFAKINKHPPITN